MRWILVLLHAATAQLFGAQQHLQQRQPLLRRQHLLQHEQQREQLLLQHERGGDSWSSATSESTLARSTTPLIMDNLLGMDLLNLPHSLATLMRALLKALNALWTHLQPMLIWNGDNRLSVVLCTWLCLMAFITCLVLLIKRVCSVVDIDDELEHKNENGRIKSSNKDGDEQAILAVRWLRRLTNRLRNSQSFTRALLNVMQRSVEGIEDVVLDADAELIDANFDARTERVIGHVRLGRVLVHLSGQTKPGLALTLDGSVVVTPSSSKHALVGGHVTFGFVWPQQLIDVAEVMDNFSVEPTELELQPFRPKSLELMSSHLIDSSRRPSLELAVQSVALRRGPDVLDQTEVDHQNRFLLSKVLLVKQNNEDNHTLPTVLDELEAWNAPVLNPQTVLNQRFHISPRTESSSMVLLQLWLIDAEVDHDTLLCSLSMSITSLLKPTRQTHVVQLAAQDDVHDQVLLRLQSAYCTGCCEDVEKRVERLGCSVRTVYALRASDTREQKSIVVKTALNDLRKSDSSDFQASKTFLLISSTLKRPKMPQIILNDDLDHRNYTSNDSSASHHYDDRDDEEYDIKDNNNGDLIASTTLTFKNGQSKSPPSPLKETHTSTSCRVGARMRRGLISTLKRQLRSPRRPCRGRRRNGEEEEESKNMISNDKLNKIEMNDTSFVADISSHLDSTSSSSLNLSSCSNSSISTQSSSERENEVELASFKGKLSLSWQSLNKNRPNTIAPKKIENIEETSSVSEISVNSLSSALSMANEHYKGSYLVLEITEEPLGLKRHYLMDNMIGRLKVGRKQMVKLHVFKMHIFAAKHVKRGTKCSVCDRKIGQRLGKQAYECRDCHLVCHKPCHVKVATKCPQSSLGSIELLRGSTLVKAANRSR